MGLIRVPVPWYEQPTERAEIDWGNPDTEGLVSLLADFGPDTHSLIGGLSSGDDVGRAPRRFAGDSYGVAYRGQLDLDWHEGPELGLANQPAVTLIGLVVRTGAGSASFSGPIGLGSASPVVAMETSTGGFPAPGVFFSAWNSSGGRSNLFISSDAELAPLDRPQVVAVRVAGGTLSAFYNGRLLGSTSGPTVLRTFGALQKGRSQNLRFNGLVPIVGAWARGLSDAAIARISANPSALLVERSIYIPTPAAGGGTVALSAAEAIDIGATTARPRVTATVTGSPSGTLYAVIYPDGSPPTAAQVVAGWAGTAVWAGNVPTPTITGILNWPTLATGLPSATQLRVAFAWSDGATTSAVASSARFETLSAPTIPVLSAATVYDVGTTTAGLRVTFG